MTVLCTTGISAASPAINLGHMLRPDQFLDALRVKAAGGLKDDSADCYFWQSATQYPEYADQKLVSSFDKTLIKLDTESADRIIVEVNSVTQVGGENDETKTKTSNFYIAWVP